MTLWLTVIWLFSPMQVQHFLNFQQILVWLDSLGIWGGVMFVVIYILATVLFIPGSLLTLGAGVIFGVINGSILVSLGATLGATVAFLVGRYLARGWVSKRIEDQPKFKAIDGAIAKEGWKIVGLLRLSPLFPFNLLNYSLGLTQVSLRDYFFASWLGMIPGTIMYVYLGSLGGNLVNLGTGKLPDSPLRLALNIIGLAAAVTVTLYISKLAKKALEEEIL